ncbi:MAG: DsbA family protein [Gammaproteobacteria bacterium]
MACTLYYVHDPMCSWCYAFESALTALRQSLPRQVEFRKVVGGLAPDTDQVMPEDLQRYVQSQWRRIEERFPSTRFNYAFWRENTPIRATYPACRAVLAAKRQGLQFEDPMIANIQAAYYRQAKNPALPETLLDCARLTGVDMQRFAADYANPEIEAELNHELQLAKSLAVNAFPSLRLVCNGRCSNIDCRYEEPSAMLADIVMHLNRHRGKL